MFPDRAEAAHWWGEDTACDPPRHRSLITEQVQLLGSHTWVAANASTLGVSLINVTITSSYPDGFNPSRPGLQLTKLFDNPYMPLNLVTWVTTGAEFVRALVEQKTPNIVVLANMTVSKNLWPAKPVQLNRDLTIVGWSNRATVLNWDGAVELITLNYVHNLKLRESAGSPCASIAPVLCERRRRAAHLASLLLPPRPTIYKSTTPRAQATWCS